MTKVSELNSLVWSDDHLFLCLGFCVSSIYFYTFLFFRGWLRKKSFWKEALVLKACSYSGRRDASIDRTQKKTFTIITHHHTAVTPSRCGFICVVVWKWFRSRETLFSYRLDFIDVVSNHNFELFTPPSKNLERPTTKLGGFMFHLLSYHIKIAI